ncbi:uncharacterized protein BCR38DRAFT_406552 [Pseudomassariella vexata]|uniref:G-patch domain-containing protein n=1 Tax=Pseudomassariella vexata TaxID=1141098 RepID=A0A1Y2EBF3_9PEZI|nr:uncharacterized protein BCR38DRAFT_406552 [Pseudomassariella vexata]ORY68634.1 hypothetical protein BCR38DRAFT_406552 [Pseudomassariella vexata]
MNAHALLTSQGWRGKGHSLHPTSDDTGLKHHLLIKREGTDGAGLGSKKDHKAEAWWMNAFDQALKGIDVTKTGGWKQNATSGKSDLAKITARGSSKYTGSRGLYQSFVLAGTLAGTLGNGGLLTPPDSSVGTPTPVEHGKKSETKEERRARKEVKKAKKAEDAAREEAEAKAAARAARKTEKKREKKALKAEETKEERKARREARRARKEDKRRRKG